MQKRDDHNKPMEKNDWGKLWGNLGMRRILGLKLRLLTALSVGKYHLGSVAYAAYMYV